MPPVYRNATEKQFQEWERLIDQGVPRFEASRIAGTTLRKLRNADAERFEQGVELSKERQAAMVEKLIVDQTDRPEPSPQLLALRAKATHPDYTERRQVELTAAVRVEHKGVDAGELFNILAAAGAFENDPALGALPIAGELLPARPE